jgi:hypothetical protein
MRALASLLAVSCLFAAAETAQAQGRSIPLRPSTALRADVRYAVGFSDIHEASDGWTEVKNRAWAASAGLAFRF